MTVLNTHILPIIQTFNLKENMTHGIDFKAVCIFAATGFFMDDDTYWTHKKCLLPAHDHTLDENGFLLKSVLNFEWHYSPQEISFEETLHAYIELLTTVMKEQVGDSPVILPLSGGLDSRSQAIVLKDFDNPVHAYSYEFQGGFRETFISQQIASVCGFRFDAYTIPKGYLWDCIDELAQINQCYSEFTHPRQMAILPQLKQMEGVFSLGHWGDVLFDRGAPEGTKESDIIALLLKKMLKPGGFYLAEQLWKQWGLEGEFKDYLVGRIETSLSKIKIDNISAKVRAFKTSQWANRWTTTNLSVFEAAHPITLPYYDNRMCEFICTVPEAYLADRRLQIAHIKQDKALAAIPWHAQYPFNLNMYHYNRSPFNLPYRVINKLQRELNALLGQPHIQRNFELQFLGEDNDAQLQSYLFEPSFLELVPKALVQNIYDKFKSKEYVAYSHPISMLLTLSVWNQQFNTH